MSCVFSQFVSTMRSVNRVPNRMVWYTVFSPSQWRRGWGGGGERGWKGYCIWTPKPFANVTSFQRWLPALITGNPVMQSWHPVFMVLCCTFSMAGFSCLSDNFFLVQSLLSVGPPFQLVRLYILSFQVFMCVYPRCNALFSLMPAVVLCCWCRCWLCLCAEEDIDPDYYTVADALDFIGVGKFHFKLLVVVSIISVRVAIIVFCVVMHTWECACVCVRACACVRALMTAFGREPRGQWALVLPFF